MARVWTEGARARRRKNENAPLKPLTKSEKRTLAAWEQASPALQKRLSRAGARSLEDVLEPSIRDALYQSYIWNRCLTMAAMRGLTPVEFCEKIGRSRTAATAYASGKAGLPLTVVFAAARVLGVPVYTLFAGMDEPAASMPYDVILDFVGRRLKRQPSVILDRFRAYLVLRFGEAAVHHVEDRLERYAALDDLKRRVKAAPTVDHAAEDAHPQKPVPARELFRTLPVRRPKEPEVDPLGPPGTPVTLPLDPASAPPGEYVAAPKGPPWYVAPAELSPYADERMGKPRPKPPANNNGWVTRRKRAERIETDAAAD